jgi:hypothetical protein
MACAYGPLGISTPRLRADYSESSSGAPKSLARMKHTTVTELVNKSILGLYIRSSQKSNIFGTKLTTPHQKKNVPSMLAAEAVLLILIDSRS